MTFTDISSGAGITFGTINTYQQFRVTINSTALHGKYSFQVNYQNIDGADISNKIEFEVWSPIDGQFGSVLP
jgi:hypothetical protein